MKQKSKSEVKRVNYQEKRKKLLTKNSPFAVRESYVKLRTNLMFCMRKEKDRACKTFVVTSPNPSEGKSLTAANIAISFAMLGKNTVLVDCDMRKPTVGKIWNVNVKSGIGEFLARIAPCELSKVNEDIPLTIISCCDIPANPSELLVSESMKALIAGLSSKFDYVVIDTPPISTVADAQIIAPLVDGVVIVSRAGSTTMDELQEAISLIEYSGGNLCGVVLNDIEPKTGKYSYKYKYKYGYSKYGYGKYGYGKYGYGKNPYSDKNSYYNVGYSSKADAGKSDTEE